MGEPQRPGDDRGHDVVVAEGDVSAIAVVIAAAPDSHSSATLGLAMTAVAIQRFAQTE